MRTNEFESWFSNDFLILGLFLVVLRLRGSGGIKDALSLKDSKKFVSNSIRRDKVKLDLTFMSSIKKRDVRHSKFGYLIRPFLFFIFVPFFEMIYRYFKKCFTFYLTNITNKITVSTRYNVQTVENFNVNDKIRQFRDKLLS